MGVRVKDVELWYGEVGGGDMGGMGAGTAHGLGRVPMGGGSGIARVLCKVDDGDVVMLLKLGKGEFDAEEVPTIVSFMVMLNDP